MHSNKQAPLPSTGERMVSQLIGHSLATEDVYDHLHRYAKALDLVAGKNILDIASGEGYGSSLLAKAANHVTGVDISQEAVDFASEKYKSPNLKFLVGSADAIPLLDNSIDVVVSFETLEHHDKHDEMFAEIKRILRPGGVLIMSTPDIDNYKDKGELNHFHVKELTLIEFKQLIDRHFTFRQIYFQRYVQASLIVAEEQVSDFKEFQGDFEAVVSSETIKFPYYNICVASDAPINADYNSIFHNYKPNMFGEDYLKHLLSVERIAIVNSKTYKLGNAIAAPLRILKKIFN